MATAKTEATVEVTTLVVKSDKNFRAGTARDTYWTFVKSCKGQTIAEIEASFEKLKAEAWTARLAGEETGLKLPAKETTYDALKGWIRFFKSEGLVDYRTSKVPVPK